MMLALLKMRVIGMVLRILWVLIESVLLPCLRMEWMFKDVSRLNRDAGS